MQYIALILCLLTYGAYAAPAELTAKDILSMCLVYNL